MYAKAKQGEKETKYSNSKTQKYEISINKISVEIHQCNWLISEMYANRTNIEQIWIKYHSMYYPNYEVGANAYNTSDRVKIENMFKICKKIVLVELIVSLIVGVIFFCI